MTKELLSHYFDYIDLNDIADLSESWKKLNTSLKRSGKGKPRGKIDCTYPCNMTEVNFDNQYNLIYGNWALGYLNDEDAYHFLKKAKPALHIWNNKPGIIIIKETIGEQ